MTVEGTHMTAGEIHKVLRGLYAFIDSEIQESLAEVQISCARGCYSCCRIVACTVWAEGRVLAGRLLGMPPSKREAIARRLKETAVPLGMSNDDYARLGHHCGFLDMETKDCVVYEDRPAACRYHFVRSDPKLCVSDEPRTVEVLDLLEAEACVHRLSESIVGKVIAAPLPNMVLHALVGMDPLQQVDPLQQALLEGVPSPEEWMSDYMQADNQELKEMKRALAEAERFYESTMYAL